MKLFKIQILILMTILTAACSNQWREADDSLAADSAFALVNELGAGLQGSSFTQDQSSVVYFTESGSAGLPESIMSFGDMSAFGYPASVFELGLSYVGVALVDSYSSGQRRFSLLIKMQSNSQSLQPVALETSDYFINEEKFEAVFQTSAGELLIRTFDIDDTYSDELAPVIHLKAYLLQGSEEIPVGQFSSLRGFE